MSTLKKNVCTSFSIAGDLSSSVCVSVRKKKDYSNIAGLALEPDSSSKLEIYVGFRGRPDVVHCRTYSISVHVIEKSKTILKQHV